ncbi:MAG: hypothetical protein QM820_22235 [Minicystis sp.]
MSAQGHTLEGRAARRVGTTLRGKYRIERVVGAGGMATVYAAIHRNGHRVAIKMLHEELSIRGDTRARFLREGYVANMVGHAGAVRVIDDDVADDGFRLPRDGAAPRRDAPRPLPAIRRPPSLS